MTFKVYQDPRTDTYTAYESLEYIASLSIKGPKGYEKESFSTFFESVQLERETTQSVYMLNPGNRKRYKVLSRLGCNLHMLVPANQTTVPLRPEQKRKKPNITDVPNITDIANRSTIDGKKKRWAFFGGNTTEKRKTEYTVIAPAVDRVTLIFTDYFKASHTIQVPITDSVCVTTEMSVGEFNFVLHINKIGK